MRIFLPAAPADHETLRASPTQLEIAEGRAAWAVTSEARADRPGVEEEDLEYDALQDAVHVALSTGERDARALVIAADVPAEALGEATDTGGVYGVVTTFAARARIAALHVTELDATAADADDTDPALLWFDPSEAPAALDFAGAGPRGV